MAFQVEDVRDLIRILEERPEWRAELRHLLLPIDLLDLPDLVRRLGEAQLRTEERLTQSGDRLAGVEDRLARVEDRLTVVEDRLTVVEDRLTRIENRLEGVEDRLARIELAVEALVLGQRLLSIDVQHLNGQILEIEYRDHASGYFGTIVRRSRVVSDGDLAELLDDAVQQGQLSAAEARDVALVDIVIRGRSQENGDEVYVLVEVSVTIDDNDVERVRRRADRLNRTGRTTIPVVAGRTMPRQVEENARGAGVWRLTNERALSPAEDETH